MTLKGTIPRFRDGDVCYPEVTYVHVLLKLIKLALLVVKQCFST